MTMSRLEHIEQSVEQLSAEELAEFARWFEDLQASRWDRRFETDVKSGKLDALAEDALEEAATGRARRL
jgi:hypothetical protein